MSAFRFRLERVLEIRRMEADRERAQADRIRQAIADLALRERQLLATRDEAAGSLRVPQAQVPQHTIEAMDGFSQYVRAQRERFAQARTKLEAELAAQLARVIEAQRRVKLLEKLKERRLADWKSATAKELEELAADSFLNRFTRPDD
jgi:flagellar FliJ protein